MRHVIKIGSFSPACLVRYADALLLGLLLLVVGTSLWLQLVPPPSFTVWVTPPRPIAVPKEAIRLPLPVAKASVNSVNEQHLPMPVTAAGASLPVASEGAVQPNASGHRSRLSHYPAKPKPVPVSINHASVQQLQVLPGVGPKLAQRIVEYRKQNGPFSTVEALEAVRGIGPKKLSKMKPYLRLTPP
ncbi:MAG: helix-hairpin-helix domain-containing protein [Candidatus Melainabacteria bacterium]|nr:helix-hairpin-helix domain-containing protein [Candidatus Melainabacteria bacterium]